VSAGRVRVVGCGIFGVTAAIALRARGWHVTIVDPGPIPHPLAESTDVSKVVRLDYGADEPYMAWMEGALDGWRRRNERWGTPLFHETGVAFLARAPMAAGGFEHESLRLLEARGHRPERLDARAIQRRFPAWSTGLYVDGYFNPEGGWAESGRVVATLLAEASDAGCDTLGGIRPTRLVERGGRVEGVEHGDGEILRADEVVVAAGSWTPALVPELRAQLVTVGQPVFHLAPRDPAPFAADRFPVFGADISTTGYYGFPALPDGRVKIANHGVGRRMAPEASERAPTEAEESALRAFLRDTFPLLQDAPIAFRRTCVYCDTADEHFWIARHPAREGLTVATGGSGHGFKFAPLLGDWIANAVTAEGDVPPRFGWRQQAGEARGEEAARARRSEA
jgi:glycine/D-amino acid oxidase-like deaminating enzyme